jgi:hypothetical protein
MVLLPSRAHHGKPWREVEDRRLREWAAEGIGARVIGVRLGRTTCAVRGRAEKLGIPFGAPRARASRPEGVP